MTKVAIIPIFKIKEGQEQAFLERVRQQRDDAMEKEPGCLHFDILYTDDPRELVLYEIYADAAALEMHRTYPHYHDFRATVEPMLESRTVQELEIDG